MKLVPIIMGYWVLQFDAFKFFFEVRLHGAGSLPNHNFFNVYPQIFERNHKVHFSNCLETNFSIFFTLIWELLDVGFKRENFLLKNSHLAIIPTSNNSQTNVRNGVKICFQAIWEVIFTIPLKNLGVYIEKIKVRLIPPM